MTEVKVGLAVVLFLRRQFPEAQRLAEESLILASRLNDSPINAAAHAVLGLTLYSKGQFTAARKHYEDSIRLFGARAPSSFGQIALAGNSAESILGMLLVPLGYPDTARARLRSALVESQRGSDPFKTSVALAPFCAAEVELHDPISARPLIEELIATASEYAIPAFRSTALLFRAWTMTFGEQADEGLDEMQRHLAASEAPAVVISVLKVALAEAFAKHRKLRESLATLENGLADPQRNAEAEFHRVKGEVLLLGMPRDEAGAERTFRGAIDIARSQAARLYELRATTRLARLLRGTGRRDEARTMLGDIYDWFTEGFDTADLKDAKALLAELSA